jgi:3-hydroxyacyl-[acyl-carrier-protein] dehydratase
MTEVLDIKEILKILPHRYPFVLIDRIIQLDPEGEGSWTGRKAQAIKNVSINENFFTGHFPENPVMPGVLILEAMAQTCAVCGYRADLNDGMPQVVYIAAIDNAKFRRPVVPGDQLRIQVECMRDKKTVLVFRCEAFVGENLVAEADLMAKAFPRNMRSEVIK